MIDVSAKTNKNIKELKQCIINQCQQKTNNKFSMKYLLLGFILFVIYVYFSVSKTSHNV